MLMMLWLGLAEMPCEVRLLMLMMLLLGLAEVKFQGAQVDDAVPKCPSALLKYLPFFQSGPKIGAPGRK